MAEKLTDAICKNLAAPTTGNKIYWDSEVRGFGLRVTAAGSRSYVFDYRNAQRQQKRLTIGDFASRPVKDARDIAKQHLRAVEDGRDPQSEKVEKAGAKLVKDLWERFETEELPKLREKTARDYRDQWRRFVGPELGNLVVAEVSYDDIDTLHRKISQGKFASQKRPTPTQANRTIAFTSKLFTLAATKWRIRKDGVNPCKGIDKNAETKRERYLESDEVPRFLAALEADEDRQAGHILLLSLLTGARSGEVKAMRWDQLNLAAGIWSKPASTTKQKKDHAAPLNTMALDLVNTIHQEATEKATSERTDISPWVFPGRLAGAHRAEIKDAWERICAAAGLTMETETKAKNGRKVTKAVKSIRMHDLRHSFASFAMSGGVGLDVIGRLVGHSQQQTTLRYSHLNQSAAREASEVVSNVIQLHRAKAA